MTSATGRPSDRRRARGFSLIELLLVLALLVVAVSIVSPRIAGFIRGRSLHTETHRMLAAVRNAQSRAVSQGFPTVVWLDAAGRNYGVSLETAAGKADPTERAFPVDESVRFSVTAATGTAVTFRNQPAIRWQPDGSVDEGSPTRIGLEDAAGARLWLVRSADRRGYEIQNPSN